MQTWLETYINPIQTGLFRGFSDLGGGGGGGVRIGERKQPVAGTQEQLKTLQ